MTTVQKQSLLNNSRFYILLSSILVSVVLFSWLRLAIPSDQLFYIRTQQVFGLLCVAYWYIALVISPLGYVIGKQRMKRIEFARRAIGVSAFYFALLHASIALWGQLGGLSDLGYLPELFKWSLLGGLIAFSILLLMAITSFDGVVKFMTYRKWKWLHRLVYIGGILAVLHIWTVGTHLAYTNVQLIAFVALVILVGLELYRTTLLTNQKYLHLGKSEMITLFATCWVIVSLLIFSIPATVQNYHSRHSGHSSQGAGE